MTFYVLFPGHKLYPKSGDLVCPEFKLAELQLPMVMVRKDVGNEKENGQAPRERVDN